MKEAQAQTLDDIADVVLVDSHHEKRRMGDFWAEDPVIFVWLRHYG